MLFQRVLLLLSLLLNSTLNCRLLELRQRLRSDAAATGLLANQKRAGTEICPRGCCVPASAPKRAARSHTHEIKFFYTEKLLQIERIHTCPCGRVVAHSATMCSVEMTRSVAEVRFLARVKQ